MMAEMCLSKVLGFELTVTIKRIFVSVHCVLTRIEFVVGIQCAQQPGKGSSVYECSERVCPTGQGPFAVTASFY